MTEHIVFIEASLTGAGEKTCNYAHCTGRTITLVCRDPSPYQRTGITKYIDHLIVADTNDASDIVRVLEDINNELRISGITTTNDFYVIQTAIAAEHFGLPTTPAKAVAKIKNKYLMRSALDQTCPELNPAFTLATTLDEANLFAEQHGYPLVAKPQDANDSLYVKMIRDRCDLEGYFDDRKNWGNNTVGQPFATGVLLEELVDGEEFCLDLLKPWNQDFILIGAFTKKLAGREIGNFIKIGAAFPAPESETMQLYNSMLESLKSLGIKAGAVNIDCRLSAGKCKILEINPRLVGDQMGSHMIELATDQNPAHAVVEIALGKPVVWTRNINRCVAIHRLTMPQAGYFYGISNFDVITMDPNVAYINELGTRGRWYDPAKSNQDVVGSIIAVGSTLEAAMATATSWAERAEIACSKELLEVSQPVRMLFNPNLTSKCIECIS